MAIPESIEIDVRSSAARKYTLALIVSATQLGTEAEAEWTTVRLTSHHNLLHLPINHAP